MENLPGSPKYDAKNWANAITQRSDIEKNVHPILFRSGKNQLEPNPQYLGHY